ncbi:CRISPR-associated protein Csh1 [Algoriphagus ornithinivorans]|uniref:CRISPR-associated protein Csh1 n=1 Tax=Algoriphagus ornithinivorans TaxID=226506 RepID=A0A1I5E4Q5_9BACT|nr:hypothetical protein [Algoriphagus ornithinivorans]SFO06397.1 CRISPR-associated protein Csh1 [Algoriphagus ornithinivorans]
MIKELAQFVNQVPDIVRERAIKPKVGLHILVRFDENGNGKVIKSERYLGKKHGETTQFLKDCALKQVAAWMIDTNKCFDLPAKGIHSASPYCFAFKRESWKGGDKYPTDSDKPDILKRSEGYFQKSLDEKYGQDESEKQRALQFRNFLKAEMAAALENIDAYADLDSSDYILIYRDEPIEKYEAFRKVYAAEGLFNTADYNIELDGEVYGTSNFYNGFNSKKPFLTHQTASFDITYRISAAEAKALSDFNTMVGKRLFPNPAPMFIDQPELTEDIIQLYYRSEDRKLSHREIISELLNKYHKDLGNYYLIYFSFGKKIEIKDFDFVSKFKYLLSDEKDEDGNPKSWVIENVTEVQKFINKKEREYIRPIPLANVFDFEREVIGRLFDYKLVNYDDQKGVSFRYFEDIESKGHRPAMFSLILKYRKPIYDFIYKSMRSSIGRYQFEDICLTGILDDLKDGKEYAIKSKLNIYFSLRQYFYENKNPSFMPSKIDEHKALMAKVVSEEATHFDSDEGYAFGAGQLIYFLLSKSEAGDLTHAVLEPFLQKTNHAHFNEAIAGILLKYKHAIGFDFKRFNKLASEVLVYIPQKGLSELRPFLLAGYFCPNILFQSKKIDSPSKSIQP